MVQQQAHCIFRLAQVWRCEDLQARVNGSLALSPGLRCSPHFPVMGATGQTGTAFRVVVCRTGGSLQVGNAMSPFAEMLLWTALAGACIPLGAGLTWIERMYPSWLERAFRHFAIAFGGGVLVGAVALVLVPEGSRRLPDPLAAVVLMLAGGAAFMLLDRAQARLRRTTPQFIAMSADFLPESLALGGMFAGGAEGAALLALLIGLQNLPEGFNAWRELRARRSGRGAPLLLMAVVGFLGPACALAGWYWLADREAVLGAVMLFAAGGILYLTFQDIAPQSRMRRRWEPPLGAVLGFALALAAQIAFEAPPGQ